MSKVQKRDDKIFDELVEKFSALYGGKNHEDFQFTHLSTTVLASHQIFPNFNSDLILLLLCLKKKEPNADFFDSTLFSWEKISEVENKFKKNKQILDDNLFKYKSENNLDGNRMQDALKKLLDERKTITSFIELNNSKVESFFRKHFPLLRDSDQMYDNGLRQSWSYLDECLIVKDFKSSRNYVIELCNSIPKTILKNRFNELIDKVTSILTFRNEDIDNVFEILFAFSKKYKKETVCLLNPTGFMHMTNVNIDLMPIYPYEYEKFEFYSSHNQFYLKSIFKNNNKINELIDFASDSKKSYDFFLGHFLTSSKIDQEAFSIYIQKIYKNLIKNGNAIMMVNKDNLIDLSENLHKIDFHVEKIISLFNYSCIFLKKTNKPKKYIEVFEGLDFIIEKNEKKIINKKIIDSFINKDPAYYSEILYKDFISVENKKSLNITRYLMPDFEGTKLSKYLSPLKGSKNFNEKTGLIVKISDLTNEVFDDKFQKNLKTEPIPQSFKKIEESCFMLASKGISLKPTFFDFSDNPIFVSNNVFTFKISDTIIPDFLKLMLDKEKTKAQLKFIQSGNIIPFYKQSDLLNKIKITVPSTQDQTRHINDSIRKYIGSFFNKFSIKNTESLEKDKFDDFQHRIGGFLSSIGQAVVGVKNLSSEIKKYEDSIKPRLERIELNITNINNLIKSYTKVKQYVNEIIKCSEIIDKIKMQFSDTNFLKIKTNFKKHKSKYEENGIEAHIEPINHLIGEVIENAKKHGGYSVNKDDFEIIINFELKNNNLILDIKNNGKPMDGSMNKEMFVKRGSTTNKLDGNGIGGSMINDIINNFENCSWDIINKKDKNYPVQFIFKFGLIQLN